MNEDLQIFMGDKNKVKISEDVDSMMAKGFLNSAFARLNLDLVVMEKSELDELEARIENLKESVSRHEDIEDSEREECPHCGKYFKGLPQHIKYCDENPDGVDFGLECDGCGEKFNNRKMLKLHECEGDKEDTEEDVTDHADEAPEEFEEEIEESDVMEDLDKSQKPNSETQEEDEDDDSDEEPYTLSGFRDLEIQERNNEVHYAVEMEGPKVPMSVITDRLFGFEADTSDAEYTEVQNRMKNLKDDGRIVSEKDGRKAVYSTKQQKEDEEDSAEEDEIEYEKPRENLDEVDLDQYKNDDGKFECPDCGHSCYVKTSFKAHCESVECLD